MPKLYDINGVKKWLYSKKDIQRMFGLPADAMRRWLTQGILPETPLTSNTQFKERLYCWEQIEPIIVHIAWKRIPVKIRDRMKEKILTDWMKIDIFKDLAKEDYVRVYNGRNPYLEYLEASRKKKQE